MFLSTRLNYFFCILLSFSICPVAISQEPAVKSLSFGSGQMSGKAPDSRGWTDPALNHNKLMQQQLADGQYKLIGPYKVLGSQFLYGEHLKADMFALEAKALNIFISYNTYNQEVEFYSTANPDKPLIKETGDVDSFTLQQNTEFGIATDLKFIYGTHLGSGDKFYYQQVSTGTRYTIYKRYRSVLNFSGSNYAQADLRQFDLEYEYFYYDNEKKTLKKIKPNAASIIKEFKDVTDLSGEIKNEDFDLNKEEALKKAFEIVNRAKKGF